MSITKEQSVDMIAVLEDGSLQVRTAITIFEDGALLSKNYHRNVLSPGADLTGQDDRVVAVANATWTPDVLAGNPPVVPTVPQQVTMRQARLALLDAGLLQTVNDTIAAMTGEAGDSARIEWEFSSTVERNRALVQSLGPALGLTDEQLDNLFIAASKL
jgi:hypothetical protein